MKRNKAPLKWLAVTLLAGLLAFSGTGLNSPSCQKQVAKTELRFPGLLKDQRTASYTGSKVSARRIFLTFFGRNEINSALLYYAALVQIRFNDNAADFPSFKSADLFAKLSCVLHRTSDEYLHFLRG